MKYHQQNFVVTPEVLDLITRMAEKRFTQPMMAEGLGISINTWYNLKKNNPDIKLTTKPTNIMHTHTESYANT